MEFRIGDSKYDSKTTLACSGIAALLLAGRSTPIFFQSKENEVIQVKNAVDTVINKNSVFGKNGFSVENIIHADDSRLDGISKFLRNKISRGKNAAFDIDLNRVYVNMEKIPLAAFHEMGHAHNYQNIILRKIQQTGNYFLLAGLLSAFIPKIIKKTPEDWEDITTTDRIKNKLRSASPFIVAGCMLPQLFEEGLASVKAAKFAKPLLDKKLYNKMLMGNALGFMSYLALTLGMVLVAKTSKDNSDYI